jgi:hypothetical protein
MSVLENRYRSLLRWYPVEHRRVHEEEMLGVLLAAAGPEQTRPSLRDALDLVRGGLWIRIRRTPPALADAGWRDAAALLSVIAPLILLTVTLRYALVASYQIQAARAMAAYGSNWHHLFQLAPYRFLWGVVAVVALCGARRTTAVAALVAAAADLGGFLSFHINYAGGVAAAPIILGLVTAAALAAGPGAARGRELLGRGGLAGIIVLLAVSAPLNSEVLAAEFGVNWGDRRMVAAIAALLAGGWLARTAAGRRAVVVLAAPLYAIVGPFYPGYIEDPFTRVLITMVVIPVSIGAAALAVVMVLEWLVIRPTADRDRAVGESSQG